MMKNIWSSCWKCGRRFTRRILGFCLILCAVLVSASEGNSVNTDPVKDNSKILNRQNGGKLFIELGWDIPDTSFLRSNYVEMESAAPFDGVIYRLSGKDEEGGIHHTEWAWDKSKWKWEWFIPAVEDLKSCRFQKFHHNFIRFNASPGNLNWDDDEGWSALADKVGIAARVAFQTGGRGIAPDFESYGEKQFCWKPERGLSFAETCKLARKQGARFMKAIASEYPSAVVMPLWMNSINFQIGELCAGKSPERFLQGAHYGLLPSFIDGMLDAALPEMILVDGCENGYYMNSREEYLAAAHQMRSWNGAAMNLVAPENREKYRRQVQAGFGFYLDMYLNEGGVFYFPPLEGSRLKRLYRNLSAAREAADQYVWVYGEQSRWWPMPPYDGWMESKISETIGKGRPWEEALPGVTRAIEWAKDPQTAARQEISQARGKGTLINLAQNPCFEDCPKESDGKQLEGEVIDVVPPQYIPWQDTGSEGVFSCDFQVGEGSARAAGVARGTLMQRYPVKPGETYYVEAQAMIQGSGAMDIMVRWQKKDYTWVRWHDDKTFVFEPGERMENGENWEYAGGVVKVPEDVDLLIVLLNVNGQTTPQDRCWFDNLGVYKMTDMFPAD